MMKNKERGTWEGHSWSWLDAATCFDCSGFKLIQRWGLQVKHSSWFYHEPGFKVFLARCTGVIRGLSVTGLSWEGLCGGKIRRSRCGHPRRCLWLACCAASPPGRAKWECMTKLCPFPFLAFCHPLPELSILQISKYRPARRGKWVLDHFSLHSTSSRSQCTWLFMALARGKPVV